MSSALTRVNDGTFPALRPTPRPSWRQRLFAWMTLKGEASSEQLLHPYKRRLFQEINGTVVEIGPGTGANLPYYPAGIRWIAIEPNPAMHPYLRERAAQLAMENDIRLGTAAQMDLPDDSVDVVISTLVLCSVANQEAVLAEIQRILKPGGRFLFLEHVAADQGSQQRRRQDLMQPLWSFCADGCRPNRETAEVLKRAGFTALSFDRHQLAIPITSPMIAGMAVK